MIILQLCCSFLHCIGFIYGRFNDYNKLDMIEIYSNGIEFHQLVRMKINSCFFNSCFFFLLNYKTVELQSLQTLHYFIMKIYFLLNCVAYLSKCLSSIIFQTYFYTYFSYILILILPYNNRCLVRSVHPFTDP